jgi:hypothetical protein
MRQKFILFFIVRIVKCASGFHETTIKMNKKSSFYDRGRSFSKGDYLIHVSGMVGITTGEIIYEPKNPVEKTEITLKSGHPLVDYSMKFCIASAVEQSNLYERSTV